MKHDDVRKGITNAKLNEKNSNLLFLEIFLIAVALGAKTESWWVFGATFLGLIVALFIPIIAIPLMVALSLCWGLIGFGVGAAFDSTGASIVLGILSFLMGIGVHFSALQWAKDLD